MIFTAPPPPVIFSQMPPLAQKNTLTSMQSESITESG